MDWGSRSTSPSRCRTLDRSRICPTSSPGPGCRTYRSHVLRARRRSKECPVEYHFQLGNRLVRSVKDTVQKTWTRARLLCCSPLRKRSQTRSPRRRMLISWVTSRNRYRQKGNQGVLNRKSTEQRSVSRACSAVFDLRFIKMSGRLSWTGGGLLVSQSLCFCLHGRIPQVERLSASSTLLTTHFSTSTRN